MKERDTREGPPAKRKVTQRTFEIEIDKDLHHSLSYFIRQELGYFNSMVEQLSPRLRAFPQEFLAFRDREKKLWDLCAEHAIDPQKLLDHPVDAWPEHLRTHHVLVRDQEGNPRITPTQVSMIKVAGSPARLHPRVRRSMASEMLKVMIAQAEIMHAGSKMEGFRVPIQTLQKHGLDTKRHLQIPVELVSITYDQDSQSSLITLPYTRTPIRITGYDLTEIPFKMLTIRSPHPTNGDGRWHIDFRDSAVYLINLTDHNERKRR